MGVVRATAMAVLLLSFWAVALSAQDTSFDIDIARIGTRSRFEPFRVTETEPLRGALSSGKVQGDTRVLVMDHSAGRLAFLTDQMVYHHVAQGDIDGEPWMVSF